MKFIRGAENCNIERVGTKNNIMRQLKFFPLLILITIISFYCKKKSENNDTGQLQIIKSSALANNRNALQSVYTSNDNTIKGYYYGTFNSVGEPDSITQMILNKTNGDTSINIFFDSQQRIKSLYVTYSDLKLNSFLTFDYSTANKTIVSAFYYNFISDSSKLLYQYVVDNTSNIYPLLSKTSYASAGGGLLQILLDISTISTFNKYSV